ncbi:SCO family protein [Hoeflea sp.]|uniref:SCO family protein n=1 Tax=Hoeflea sp. TaxID=1940281 RepID=UPI003B019E5C
MAAVRTVLIALIAVLGVAFAWLAFEWSRSDTALAENPYGVPFELIDQNGAPITEAAFREKPTALFFGFTHCPEVCPTTLFEMDGWLRTADPDGDAINAYFVTVDPERDSHDILGRYVSNVTERVVGITGDPEKVRAMVKGFNVFYSKVPLDKSDPDGDYTMDHYAAVFLLNNGGRFKGTIAYGENTDVAVKKLENLIDG